MAAPDKPFGYNDYVARQNDDSYVRPPTATVSAVTQKALDELEFVESWVAFVKICEAQKAKRGY